VRTSEVLPGITRLWFPGVDNNAYRLEGAEATLIDCGPPAKGNGPVLPPDHVRGVRTIAITHHHADHTGRLAATAAATEATVFGHAGDAGIIREGTPRPRGRSSSLFGKVLLAMGGKPVPIDAAPIHVEVGDDEELPGGLRALHTPGHTAGHTAYLWPEHGGVLFVGDAAANMFRHLGIAPINEDEPAARTSFARLAELPFTTACFGHGSPIRGSAASRFRRALERMR